MNDFKYDLVDNVFHADDFLRLRKEVNFTLKTAASTQTMP